MRRILLLVTVASMLAAAIALSGVAEASRPIADSADAQCAKLAIQTLGASFNPSNYTFIGGTEGDDRLILEGTAGPDVFCGFGGVDLIHTLDEGDIFLGGAGDDFVRFNLGTFYGQEGHDFVSINGVTGTFIGGAGTDGVGTNFGIFVQ